VAQRPIQSRLLSYTDLRVSPLPGQASVPQAGVVGFMESKSNEK
jgi:hypothetical protein